VGLPPRHVNSHTNIRVSVEPLINRRLCSFWSLSFVLDVLRYIHVCTSICIDVDAQYPVLLDWHHASMQ